MRTDFKGDIVGYVIKAVKVIIDPNIIRPEDMEDINESDLRISYYIGKEGRTFMNKPTDPSLMFKSKASAQSHKNKSMKDSFAGIIPVYDNGIARSTIVRSKPQWERPPEQLLTERKRQRSKKLDGKIPKLR